jgi:hypothetical protein
LEKNMLKQGFSNTFQARAPPRREVTRALRMRASRLGVRTRAPPEATRRPRCTFPMHL